MYWWSCPDCFARGVEETKRDAEFALLVHLVAKTNRSAQRGWKIAREGSHVEPAMPAVAES